MIIRLINPRGRIIDIDEKTGLHKELLKKGFVLFTGEAGITYLPSKDHGEKEKPGVFEPSVKPVQSLIIEKAGGIVVYTAITAGHDTLKEEQVTDGAQFFVFTDGDFRSKTWKVLGTTNLFRSPRRTARYHKVLSHLFFPDAQYTVWMDGTMTLKAPIKEIIDSFPKEAQIITSPHQERDCLYGEAKVCMDLDLDNPAIIEKQVKQYKKEGYPEHAGLAETKIVIRKNTPQVEQFNKEWFYQLFTGSKRDQISFNYVAWKVGIEVYYFKESVRKSKLFGFQKHIKERDETKYL